jgi:hypothetical protein
LTFKADEAKADEAEILNFFSIIDSFSNTLLTIKESL